jgi:hypothetical protein
MPYPRPFLYRPLLGLLLPVWASILSISNGPTTQHREGLQQLRTVATHDRRREERIDLELPIEVCGFDSYLRFFTERTETRNVSGWGCQFS